MTALTVTAKNVSASQEQGAVIRSYQAAAQITLAQGKPVALDSNGKLVLADANVDLAHARAIGVIVAAANAYGETTVPADGWCSVCEFGPVYGFSGLTPGVYGWVSTTAGEIDDTAPTTAYQYIIGQAMAADVFFVHPGITSPASAA